MNNNINVAVGGPINADYPKAYKTKFLKPGISFSLQVTEPNTKYIIKHNFDLGDEEIIIPENCVLEFDGGSLSNGTIIFNNALLAGKPNISRSTICAGNIQNKEIHVEWFGAIGDGDYNDSTGFTGTDNRQAFVNISNVVNASKGGTVIFEEGKKYSASVERFLNSDVQGVTVDYQSCSVLYFDNIDYVCVEMNGSTIQLSTNINNTYNIVSFSCCDKAIIRNGYLVGDGRNHSYASYHPDNNPSITRTSYEWCYGIGHGGGEILIENMNISHCCGDGVLVGTYNDFNHRKNRGIVAGAFEIKNCEISYCGRQGITAHAALYSIIENNRIHHIGSHLTNPGFAPMAGIDFEYEDNSGVLGKVVVRDCYIYECTRGAIVSGKSGENNSQCIDFLVDNSDTENVALYYIEAVNGETAIRNSKIVYKPTMGESNRIAADVFENCDIHIAENVTLLYLACKNVNGCSLINDNNPGVTKVVYLKETNFHNSIINGFKSSQISSKSQVACFDGYMSSHTIDGNFYNTKIIDTDILIYSGSASPVTEKNIYEHCYMDGCAISTGKNAYFNHCTLINCQSSVVSTIQNVEFNYCLFENTEDLVQKVISVFFASHSLREASVKYKHCNIDATVQPATATYDYSIVNALYKKCIFDMTLNERCRLFYANMVDCSISWVKTAGTTNERPKGPSIKVGFEYYDTNLNKPIFAKAIAGGTSYTVTWVDATGAPV